MTSGAMPLPPWAVALVLAALTPMLTRAGARALERRFRARSASSLASAERATGGAARP